MHNRRYVSAFNCRKTMWRTCAENDVKFWHRVYLGLKSREVQHCTRVKLRVVDRFCPTEVLKMLTDTHAVRVRHTLKDVEHRFRNRPFSELKMPRYMPRMQRELE